ncbi:hypothetical protein L564_0126 [Bordetella pertussis CHLA-15]|nr:hypothetical protein L564_0126 [Bordetella pertussis CHLA-15]
MLAIVLDAVILLGAFHLALWLRFELFFLTDQYLFLSLLACAGGIAALAAFGVYLYILRYMSERVLAAILGGIVVSVMVVTAGNTFLQLATISRGVLVLYAALALVGLIGVGHHLARRTGPVCRARPGGPDRRAADCPQTAVPRRPSHGRSAHAGTDLRRGRGRVATGHGAAHGAALPSRRHARRRQA